MTETQWMFGFLLAAFSAASGAGVAFGVLREKIRRLEADQAQTESDLKHVREVDVAALRERMAAGDTKFSLLTTKLDGLLDTLGEIKDEMREMLTGRTTRRGRASPDSKGEG